MSAQVHDATPLTGRTTALLLAVLGALVAYIWLVELRPRQHDHDTSVAVPALLAVAPAEVARVDLDEAGSRLTAVRGAHGWTDASGRPWREDAVADLVGTLGGLRPVMIVDPAPREPEDYGFGPAARHLAIATADGRSVLALELGERNPAWTGVYARRDGRPEVMLLGAVLTWELEKLRAAAPSQ
jgi:Domain of unknown function (DUF4340)